MKPLPQICLAVFASALLTVAVPAPQARAFTFEGANAVTPDHSMDLTSPTSRLESAARDGNSIDLGGGSSVHFGTMQDQSPGASFDADANRLLTPLGRPGESGRFR